MASDGGSMTPSEHGDDDEHTEHDSDYETDNEEEDSYKSPDSRNIQWTGYGKRVPVLLFKVDPVINKKNDCRIVGESYHLAYKFGSSECKIVRNIFNFHGFHEVHPNSADYNIVWTNSHLKPFTLRTMTEFQKINHFPRSYELTRKDRLFKNIQRMQQLKGLKHFDFIPNSFILPSEYQEFCSCFLREKGHWIVKPVASSRGRGVFLVSHPDQVPLDENIIVSRYVFNPLLIDGFKFDVRLYVAVTSYDPLVIYLFEEGLTRFATVKFERSSKNIRNQCMHLTNYSVNKKSQDFVRNDDPEVEDYGNKWSLGAMLRYLRSDGKDTAALMMRIEDVVIKTIISVELQIATACKMFMPYRGNCFELYGFDILIDETLKPWLLEVNLSPSLACDSPLDLKIKTNMLCDLFGLAGVVCHDPMLRTLHQSKRNHEIAVKIAARSKSARVRPTSATSKPRPMSASSPSNNPEKQSSNSNLSGLNSEEIKLVRRIKEEDQRRGGWVRIFPTPDSWEIYSNLLQFNTTHNLTLHQKLYPERHKTNISKPSATPMTSVGARSRMGHLQITGSGQCKGEQDKNVEAYAQAILRTRQYERRLGHKKKKNKNHMRRKPMIRRELKNKLVQGVPDDVDEEDEQQSDEESSPGEATPLASAESQAPAVVEAQPQHKEEPEKMVEKNIVIVVEDDPTVESSSAVKSCSAPPMMKENKLVYIKDNERGKPEPEANAQELTMPCPIAPNNDVEEKYDVVELLKKGERLSKIQARSAFAMYLLQVQHRLTSELGRMSQEDIDALNEQMDLVLRFLKRAAVNLQQPFKVIVPSRKLVLADRRRILAKQLGDFVHIYNKESEQLKIRKKMDKKQLQKSESVECLNEHKFMRFVHSASECELEEVLTTYTKLNKSASIFLGSNSKSNHMNNSQSSINLNMYGTRSESSLMKRRDSFDLFGTPVNGMTSWDDPTKVHSASNAADIRRDGAGMPNPHRPTSALHANTVTIYSQKLSRPHSASPHKTGVQVVYGGRQSTFTRPSSSSIYATYEPTVDTYNEQAIHEALQRLSIRQQARQYAALNGTSVLSQDHSSQAQNQCAQSNTNSRSQLTEDMCGSYLSTSKQNVNTPNGSHHKNCPNGNNHISDSQKTTPSIHRYISMEEHLSRTGPTSSSSQRTASVAGYENLPPSGSRRSRQQMHTNVNQQNANATFNNFIEEPGWHNGLNSQSTMMSRQYQLAQQAAFKQQKLMEQSKLLLEQSKAKHQAMVAQAHAAQRTTEVKSENGESSTFTPKPPVIPGPGKKLVSSHRLARTAIADEGGGLSFNFYNSLKYDIHTGKTNLRKGED